MISPPRLGLKAGARVRPGLNVEVSHASPAIAITGRLLVDIGDSRFVAKGLRFWILCKSKRLMLGEPTTAFRGALSRGYDTSS